MRNYFFTNFLFLYYLLKTKNFFKYLMVTQPEALTDEELKEACEMRGFETTTTRDSMISDLKDWIKVSQKFDPKTIYATSLMLRYKANVPEIFVKY